MTRAVFNTTYDFRGGLSSASPGIVTSTGACRLVAQLGIATNEMPGPLLTYWLTTEEAVPKDGWIAPLMTYDWELSDLVAVPSGSAVRFWVVHSQLIIWRGQTPYYRAMLAELPGPPVPAGDAPGASCEEVAPFAHDVEIAHAIASPDEHWWDYNVPPNPEGLWRLEFTLVSGSVTLRDYLPAPDCSNLILMNTLTDSGCLSWGFSGNGRRFLRVTGDGEYSFIVLEGSCP